MYIAPNTNIKILRNVPLDATYDHTIYFAPGTAGLTAQYNYFNSKVKYNLTEQSYQRVKKGRIRVNVLADNLYDCNYLMFKNTSFGAKWFYAFITSVEYINNAVSEIEFEIDVMQTWNNNYTLQQSYVIREHMAAGDTLPLYTDENIQPGELTYSVNNSVDMTEMNLVILSTPANDTAGSIRDNTYMKVGVTDVFPVTSGSVPAIDSHIQQLTENNENIIAMYQYPSIFYSPITGTNTILKHVSRATTVDGYTPRNKKLLYFPYSFIRVSGQNGKYQDYAYEMFLSTTSPSFRCYCVVIPECNVVVAPLNYKNQSVCYEEKMIISDFPVCAWANNTFEQWWAGNKWSILFNGLSKALAGSTVKGALNNIDWGLSQAGNIMQAIDLPNNVSGNTSAANINAAIGAQTIQFYQMSIISQRAAVIDEYFDRYGYATNRNKIPNRNVRPHWTYTRTQNCTIRGPVPSDDAKTICNIYNRGITFWSNGDEVGNYNLNNTIAE